MRKVSILLWKMKKVDEKNIPQRRKEHKNSLVNFASLWNFI